MATSFETVALSKLITEKALKSARAEVEAGSYKIDCTVKVQGEIVVSEDYSKASTVSVPWRKVVAILLRDGGIAPAVAFGAIMKSLEISDEDPSVVLAEEQGIGPALAEIEKKCAALPQTICKGPVKAKLSVEVLSGS